MIRIVFKAQIGNGPVQEVGGYEFLPDEWEEELNGNTQEDWLRNAGVDWAYEAVHTDNLRYWAEREDD